MKLQILGILCKGFGIFVLVVVQQAQRVKAIAGFRLIHRSLFVFLFDFINETIVLFSSYYYLNT